MAEKNNNLLYGAVVIIAVLVFVGAAIAVSSFSSAVYDVSVNLAASSAGTLYPYQTTSFNITVTNNGGKEIVGLPLAFYINGGQNNYSKVTIPAHGSVSMLQNYTYIKPGGYLFTAAVHPGNVLSIANRAATRMSKAFAVENPEGADVYESVPNANITYTDSFTTSGTGLLTASLMGNLFSITSLVGINGPGGGILESAYKDLYPYVSVANGAYSVYSNGSASYVIWMEGEATPQALAQIVSSFNKKIGTRGSGSNTIIYATLNNATSLCSYYQGGWTKIIEFYNATKGGSCLGFAANGYSPTEGNALVTALRSTRLGTVLTANQLNSSKQIQWSRFYYVNATILGQTFEFQSNAVAASTLFQLASPSGVFLSRIEDIKTNLSDVNATCLGLAASVNGTNFCSIILPTNGTLGSQHYGAVYTDFISPNYTVEVYSLVNETELIAAHENAGELISRLGINSTSVAWHSPFKNACAFQSGFGCNFEGFGANGSVSLRITNLNYSTVKLDNLTCAMGAGFPAIPLNGTLAQGENTLVQTFCHSIPVPDFAAQSSFQLNLGYTYRTTPMIVNGTLNVTSAG